MNVTLIWICVGFMATHRVKKGEGDDLLLSNFHVNNAHCFDWYSYTQWIVNSKVILLAKEGP